eukprot:scaffold198377_cov15-Tisochrysis_lutea.AAC.1
MSANAGLAAIGGARDSSISMVDLTAGRVASQLQPCESLLDYDWDPHVTMGHVCPAACDLFCPTHCAFLHP